MAPHETQHTLAALSDAVLARVPAAARRRVDIDLLPSSSSSSTSHSHRDPHPSGADSDDAALGLLIEHEQRELERRAGGALDWESVSLALRVLHAETQREFTATTEQLTALDAQVQQQLQLLQRSSDPENGAGAPDETVDKRIQTTHADVGELLRELHDSESHFHAVAELVAPATRKLAQLEARESYYQAALEVEKRSQHAKAQAIQATSDALDAFQDFTAFAATLPVAYTHIRREAERRIAALTQDLKTFALEKLQSALESVAWPAELTAADMQNQDAETSEIGRAFHYLLALQLSQQSPSGKPEESEELWAVACLFTAILARFRYHFERPESQTNRLAKPEWFLSHILSQARDHALFLERVISPQLEKQSARLACCDAQVLLVRALIRAAHRKLRKEIPSLISQKALFCHTLDEVLLFEQAIDDEFGYATYANTNRTAFPRCVDVFTEDMSVFIAWTSVDVDYAKHMLLDVVFDDQKKAWAIADAEDFSAGGEHFGDVDDVERTVPRGVLHFASLLDFMCRRFTFMASEEHRFLYLTQVHHLLLKDMLRECESQARATNVHGANAARCVSAIAELCVVVNAVQYMINLLSAWEQSSVFIELTKKVVQSERSRSQVLKIHLEYSKSVLKNAAQAASNAVLTREEAVAVRQAIAGPGSLIGPTAAFSAAYSVGSKTMRSLLGRSDNIVNEDDHGSSAAGKAEAAHGVSVSDALPAAEQTEEEEELIFSRSIFERQIAEFKSLLQRLLNSASDVLLSAFQRDAKAYKQSLYSAAANSADGAGDAHRDVSPELGTSLTHLTRVFAVAKKLLAAECQARLVKSVAKALDELLFDVVVARSLSDSYSSQTAVAHTLGLCAREQFAYDVAMVATVLERLVSKSRKYMRKTSDLANLFALESAKLRELRNALVDESELSGATASMEQITTMLEVCKVFSMHPEQVLQVCDQIL